MKKIAVLVKGGSCSGFEIGLARRLSVLHGCNCLILAAPSGTWPRRSMWLRSLHLLEVSLFALFKKRARALLPRPLPAGSLRLGDLDAGPFDLILSLEPIPAPIKPACKAMVFIAFGTAAQSRAEETALASVAARAPTIPFAFHHASSGGVWLEGRLQTKRSYTESLLQLREETTALLEARVMALLRGGAFAPDRAADVDPGWSSASNPRGSSVLAYLAELTRFCFGSAWRRLVLRERESWRIAFQSDCRAPRLPDSHVLQNPSGGYFADPFVVKENNRTVCFVEEFSRKHSLGRIVAIELKDDGGHMTLGPVLEEPFHLSFPFVFRHEGELFMVPECHQANAVRLYRCLEFPLRWKYERDLLSGVSAADSLVFPFDGRWWLFCTLASPGCRDRDSQLHLFWSENPVHGDWRPHAANPVMVDSLRARNGGLLFDAEGRPIRARQRQGFACYGEALSLARIERLDPFQFLEQEIAVLEPALLPGASRLHHLHGEGSVYVFDFFAADRR